MYFISLVKSSVFFTSICFWEFHISKFSPIQVKYWAENTREGLSSIKLAVHVGCRCSPIWNNVISYWGKCKANRIVNVSRDPNEMSKFVPQPSHICREKVQSQKLNLRTSNKLIALSLSTIIYILQATILHIFTSNPDAKYLRHRMEMLGFFCHSDFTWNQFWRIYKS